MPVNYSKIHPELRQVAKKSPRIVLNNLNLFFINSLMKWMPAARVPQDILIEEPSIPGQDAQTAIRLRIYKSKSQAGPVPALIWLHGGGYVMGRPEMDDLTCAQYAREAGITVVSVDYRLAPSHPFPAGLQDSYSALQWVAAHSGGLGVDETRLAVGGASAGGGLAAALVQLACDRGEIKPVFQLLVYPMLDDRTVLRTDIDDSSNITWNAKSNRFGWEAYLGQKCGLEDAPEYCAPARRKNISGLPAAWMGVGTLDLFHAEDVAYAQRLQESGIDCEMVIVPGAFHGFDVFDPGLGVVRDFRKSQVAALKKYLALGS
jgi:acetyl esterase/lipase